MLLCSFFLTACHGAPPEGPRVKHIEAMDSLAVGRALLRSTNPFIINQDAVERVLGDDDGRAPLFAFIWYTFLTQPRFDLLGEQSVRQFIADQRASDPDLEIPAQVLALMQSKTQLWATTSLNAQVSVFTAFARAFLMRAKEDTSVSDIVDYWHRLRDPKASSWPSYEHDAQTRPITWLSANTELTKAARALLGEPSSDQASMPRTLNRRLKVFADNLVAATRGSGDAAWQPYLIEGLDPDAPESMEEPPYDPLLTEICWDAWHEVLREDTSSPSDGAQALAKIVNVIAQPYGASETLSSFLVDLGHEFVDGNVHFTPVGRLTSEPFDEIFAPYDQLVTHLATIRASEGTTSQDPPGVSARCLEHVLASHYGYLLEFTIADTLVSFIRQLPGEERGFYSWFQRATRSRLYLALPLPGDAEELIEVSLSDAELDALANRAPGPQASN